MRHPPHACPPPKPPCPDGVLLPRIIAQEKRSISRLCTELCLSPPTGCSCASLVLHSLHASPTQPAWSVRDESCARPKLCISIPVCAKLRDHCGACHPASGMIEVETPLPHHFHCLHEHQLFIQPRLRLLCAEPACAPNCFAVQVSLTLEMYLLSLQPCMMHPPKAACPPLPLYPPPMH